MKLTLEGCKHKRSLISRKGRDGRLHMTCAACYQRLVSASSDEDDSFMFHGTSWLSDSPAPMCTHSHRQGIPPMNYRQAHQDAVCTDCGVVLRHPDGPGEWVEVMFNGFLIAELP